MVVMMVIGMEVSDDVVEGHNLIASGQEARIVEEGVLNEVREPMEQEQQLLDVLFRVLSSVVERCIMGNRVGL